MRGTRAILAAALLTGLPVAAHSRNAGASPTPFLHYLAA